MDATHPGRPHGPTYLAPMPQRPIPRHVSSAHNPYSAPLTPDQLASIDTSLASAVKALVHHFTSPLAALYPHATLLLLRSSLTAILTERYTPTWRPLDPTYASGYRSLICTRNAGLPPQFRQAAKVAGVDAAVWANAVKGKPREEAAPADRERDEWEAWCDPGVVSMRYGDWRYFDAEFDPIRPLPESIIPIWVAAPDSNSGASDTEGDFGLSNISITPNRPSAAIPIRAPAMSFIPPTPAHTDPMATVPQPLDVPLHDHQPTSPSLMPAASIGTHSRSSSMAFSARSPSPQNGEGSMQAHARASTYPVGRSAGSGHRTRVSGSDSTSSIASSISEAYSGATQLLTPASRPGSADPFTTAAAAAAAEAQSESDKTPTPGHASRGRDPSPSALPNTPTTATPRTSTTPAVTPYDGGNVTVLGGGVKLGGGGGSRPASVIAQHRTPVDRSRSPSVSLASRALNSALSPGETGQPGGGGRKPRTRRRIMPTYLGYVGQPGVGGPVPHAFQPSGLKMMTPMHPQQVGGGAMPTNQPGTWGVQQGVPSSQVGSASRQPLSRLA